MGELYASWLPEVVEAAAKATGYDWDIYDDDWLYRSRSSGGWDEWFYCVMWHHTAGSDDAWADAGWQCHGSDDAPISNITIDSQLALILAGGCTNTNGSGSNSPMSFSRGVVESDNMNRRAIGLEICNDGVGAPYPERQINFLFELSNRLNAKVGNQPTDVCTHQHYAPERKPDPSLNTAVQGPWQPGGVAGGSWNVDHLRAECARRAASGGGEEEEVTQEDIDKIAEAVWSKMIDTTGGGAAPDPQPARYFLQRTFLMARQYLGPFSGSPAEDPTMLKQIWNKVK
jgi:N-acetylmuramoyl-L-alanine amidase